MAAPAIPPLVEPGPPLSRSDIQRYSRHLLLPQVGELGQRRLRNARVCIVGAGGLGAPILLYLAAAGVGHIGIIDMDDVELSNLQRQIVHGWADVGRSKVQSAIDRAKALDDRLDIVGYSTELTATNILSVLEGYDLVLDGTDNFATRYLVNDACVHLGIPLIWGSIFQFDAQVSVFWGRPPAGSAVPAVQLRDLFPQPPPPGSVPSCAEGGVIGALCGQVGSLMATEAVKLITGIGQPLLGRVLVLDVLAANWSQIPLRGGTAPQTTIFDGAPAADLAAAQTGGAVASEASVAVPEISATALAARLAARAAGEDDFLLVDVREAGEREIVAIPGHVAVPLGQFLGPKLTATAAQLGAQPVVLYCRSGARSEQALRALAGAGVLDAVHVAGGVLSWISQVDPTLPTY